MCGFLNAWSSCISQHLSSWQLSVYFWPWTDIFFFFWSLARTWMKSTLFTLWDVKNISLEVLPRPLPGVCWVEFWIPSLPSFPSTAPLRLCLEHFSQTQRVQDNLPYSTERFSHLLGDTRSSDQSIPCIFGWINNAFLLQQEGHFPSASLGTSVSLVQHKVAPSMGFYISELPVCEQGCDCSF